MNKRFERVAKRVRTDTELYTLPDEFWAIEEEV